VNISELLFNTNSAIFELYYAEKFNKQLIFNGMMMRSANQLFLLNTACIVEK
jgi:hypothetical protein